MEKTNGKLFYGWVVVAATTAVLFFGFCAGFYSFSVFLEPFQKTFGWSKSQISLGMTIAALVVGLISPVVGSMISRFGARNVQLFGAVTLGIGLLAASYMQTLLQLYLICALLIGVGVATIGQIPAQTLATHWFSERRGTAMGIVVMSIGLGAMFMVWFAGTTVEAFGWRMTYRILAALVLVLLVPLIAIVIKNKPEDMGLIPDGAPVESVVSGLKVTSASDIVFTLKEAIKTSPYILMALSYFLFAIILGALNVHAIALFHSFGIAAAATVWSLSLGVSVIGRLLFGYFADIYPKKNLILISWALHIGAMGAMIMIAGNNSYLWGFVICYGLAMGAFNTLLPLFVSDKFGAANFSQLIGVIMLANIIGIAVGSITMGHLYDASGSYQNGVMVLLVVAVLGIITTSLTGNPIKKAPAIDKYAQDI